MKTVTIAIVGAGSRGTGFGSFATANPDKATVVAVAEPRAPYRERQVRDHDIASANVAEDWKELADRERFADAVVIATQDAKHADPAVAFAEKGYHILLEKPMAPNEEDCKRIVDAAVANGIILAVGHVMRYTTYTNAFKSKLDEGAVGEIVSIQHLEPVGFWHQAHSFVRGNWRNEAESSPMLLAKSCHDLDWIRYIVGSPCKSVSSFGGLYHFRKQQKPTDAGTATRCVECPIESGCPYSAIRIYLGRVRDGHTGWPVNVLTPDVNEGSVTEAITSGPYGRCVYECDNDVVDHQVVNMQFESGASAAFTMTAFTGHGGRKTRVFGTHGLLEGDGTKIRHTDFLTGEETETDTSITDNSILGGHGGGDAGLMSSFVDAVRSSDPARVLSGPEESLETHMMVFAAERARREHRVVDL